MSAAVTRTDVALYRLVIAHAAFTALELSVADFIRVPHNRRIDLIGNDAGRKGALERRFTPDVKRRKPADQAPSF